MTEVKRDLWIIEVNKSVSQKVVFDEPVTADDALALYNNEEYADIIDEEDFGSEVVGVVDPGKEVKYYHEEEEGDN